jgi:hypothetical protein
MVILFWFLAPCKFVDKTPTFWRNMLSVIRVEVALGLVDHVDGVRLRL